MPDDQTTYREVVKTFAEMIREGTVKPGGEMQVTGSDGEQIATLRFSAEH